MKKLFVLFLILSLWVSPVFGASQWDKSNIDGDKSVSDIDYYATDINNEALDRILYPTRTNCAVIEDTAAQVKVLAGSIAIPNLAGTTVRWRRNTATTTVTWADIDTGAEAASTYYYIYVDGDTDETGFGFVISTSSSAPTGFTYYRKIGYFYNNSSGDIVNVGNIKDSDAANSIKVVGTTDITTTSTSYVDMTDMEIKFVSNGRPVQILFSAPFNETSTVNAVIVTIDVDGTDKIETRGHAPNVASQAFPLSLPWEETLAAGTHTIKVQWKVAGFVGAQEGSTEGARILIVTEL